MKMRNRIIGILFSFALLIGLMPGVSMTAHADDSLVGKAIRLGETIEFEYDWVKISEDDEKKEIYGWLTLIDIDHVGGIWSFTNTTKDGEYVFRVAGPQSLAPTGYWISGGDGKTEETAYELSLLYDYPLWIDDEQVSNANYTDILGDGTASFNPETNTLTLNGAKVTDGEQRKGRSVCIYASGIDLNIVLNGENNIGSSAVMDAIAVDGGSLTIEGDGTLNASGKQRALYASKDMKVSGGNVNAEIAGTNGKNAVRADLSIEVAVTADVKASTSGAVQDAVSAGMSVSINGGKVSAEAKGDGSCAISGQTGVTLNGGETSAYASGQYKTVSFDKYDPYGISSPEGNISIGQSAKLTAAGNEAALYAGNGNKVITGAKGVGWEDYEGTEAETAIPVSDNAQVSTYKKVRFPDSQDEVSYLEASYNAATGEVTYTEKTTSTYTLVTPGADNWGDDGTETWYVVKGDVTVPEEIAVNGTVHLILCDGAKLTADKSIIVLKGDYDDTLNIYTQSTGDDMGELVATGADRCAGIGGDESNNACGTINIHCGKITATGGKGSDEDMGCAGIGGGLEGAAGIVTVFGGTVTATGRDNAAGIGGGFGNKGGKVTVYGGTVNAYGGKNGAGIGGGGSSRNSYAHGGNVEICGGTVTAMGGDFGAGIGGGDCGDGGTVTIRGGTVVANGGDYGAGIGGGSEAAGGKVTITGGKVITAGGKTAAAMGIGKGDGSYPNGSLDLGKGVKMYISSDNSKWSQYDSSSDTRKRYMRTDKSHVHDFRYTADGDTVTATCSKDCPLPEHKATLTIAAPPHKTYKDGKDPEAVISETYSIRGDAEVKYFKAAAGDRKGEELTDAPTNAGKYWAEIKVGKGSNAATAHVIYNIEKAANPANVTAEAVAKTGSQIPLSSNVENNGATGAVGYKLYGDSKGCTVGADSGVLDAGQETGTVTVYVTVKEDDNYKESQPMKITVTITSKEPQTITANDIEATYGDTDKKVSATATGGGDISYAVKKGSGTYIEVDETTGDLTIMKAGTAYVTVTAAEATVGEVEYEKATKDVKVTINKAPNPMSYEETPEEVELPFSPYYQVIDLAEAEDAEGRVIYRKESEKRGDKIVNYCALDGTELTVDADAPAGTYTLVISATAEGNDNYESATKYSTVIIKIMKDHPSEKDPEAKILKYNGKPQKLVKAGKAAGGDMVYALGKSETDPPSGSKWSRSIPKGKDPGTYYVWFKVRGDGNHFDTEPECITVKIYGEKPAGVSTITYDLDGGSLDGQTGIVEMNYENGTVITLPEPVRDGYAFDYWEGSRYNAGDEYTVNGDHTFKAVWKTGPGGSGRGTSTGDENSLALWIALLLTAIAGTTVMALARKK